MSVTVDLAYQEATIYFTDRTDEDGRGLRYWYDLQDSGVLKIQKHTITGSEGRTTTEVIYGSTHWVSVVGDDEWHFDEQPPRKASVYRS